MTEKTHPSNDEQKTQSSKTTTTTESNNDLTGSGSKKSYPKPTSSGSGEAMLTRRACTSSSQEDGTTTTTTSTSGDNIHVMSGRERLKRHRIEVAGRVWVPDMWGQEGLLKDWIDCTAFDAALVRNNIMSAREALVQEGRIKTSSRLTGVK
ncbi:Zinc finger E-box-binding homeobox like [Actinidia chinensis var. chinensis]|uniref:Zinc finger E-box-binding homeobox like n=1 Tax=Actinidia chinensis var. chinensis TaxID=1590841 RepID=A0A2R6QW06_ACTCC|nr:Zinc finger E-box-binding homeobox like [Actinidia chinensis var. chinensis]